MLKKLRHGHGNELFNGHCSKIIISATHNNNKKGETSYYCLVLW